MWLVAAAEVVLVVAEYLEVTCRHDACQFGVRCVLVVLIEGELGTHVAVTRSVEAKETPEPSTLCGSPVGVVDTTDTEGPDGDPDVADEIGGEHTSAPFVVFTGYKHLDVDTYIP
jgi:hypothetical protein